MRMRNLAARGDEKPLQAGSSSAGWFRACVNRSYPEGIRLLLCASTGRATLAAPREWSSPRSLSQPPALGARPRGGCRLPDAILHGKRSHRPRSRAVQCVAAAGFRVRPLSPLRLVVAPPVCGPGRDTFAISSPRLVRFTRGRPPLLTVRWPRATGLTS
jgi:hypothetical protein